MDTQKAAIELILDERKRQDEKWVKTAHSDFVWNSILSGEVGEVSHEVLNSVPYSLRDEVVRVAAVAVAWLETIIEREDRGEGV